MRPATKRKKPARDKGAMEKWQMAWKEAQIEKVRNHVFALPELIERIMSHLEPKDIITVRAVAKIWKAQYDDCRQLRLAAAVPEFTPHIPGVIGQMDDAGSATFGYRYICHSHSPAIDTTSTPDVDAWGWLMYENTKFHLWLDEKRISHDPGFRTSLFASDDPLHEAIQARGNEFATMPPCPAFGILIYSTSDVESRPCKFLRGLEVDPTTHQAIVHNLEGVRVKDVLGMAATLMAQAKAEKEEQGASDGQT